MKAPKRRKRKIVAKPASEVSLKPSPWDAGASGPANRKRLVEEEAVELDPTTGKPQPNPNAVRRMRRETWIERYQKQNRLTKAEATAAANLYAAWAGHPARDPLAAIGLTVDGRGCDDPLAIAVDAKRWFYLMWEKVPRYCRPVIEHVVLNDRPLRSMAGCINGQAETRYMERLKDGLGAIC